MNIATVIEKLLAHPVRSLKINNCCLISGVRKMKTDYCNRVMLDIKESLSIFISPCVGNVSLENNEDFQKMDE